MGSPAYTICIFKEKKSIQKKKRNQLNEEERGGCGDRGGMRDVLVELMLCLPSESLGNLGVSAASDCE